MIEAYARAIHATDLTLRAEKVGAADVLIAAGFVRNRLGTALLRLRAEWDSVAVPDFSRYTDLNAYNSDMRMLFGQLKTWREARTRVHELAELHGISTITADRVLWWWLDRICDACEGRGYQTIPGTPKLSDTPCKACHGSGEVPVPGGAAGAKLAAEMEDYAARAGQTLGKRLRG